MIKHLFLIWGLLAALTAEPVLACTSAVVSGKVTPDGRPLLWKNRDTDYLRNHVAYIKGDLSLVDKLKEDSKEILVDILSIEYEDILSDIAQLSNITEQISKLAAISK